MSPWPGCHTSRRQRPVPWARGTVGNRRFGGRPRRVPGTWAAGGGAGRRWGVGGVPGHRTGPPSRGCGGLSGCLAVSAGSAAGLLAAGAHRSPLCRSGRWARLPHRGRWRVATGPGTTAAVGWVAWDRGFSRLSRSVTVLVPVPQPLGPSGPAAAAGAFRPCRGAAPVWGAPQVGPHCVDGAGTNEGAGAVSLLPAARRAPMPHRPLRRAGSGRGRRRAMAVGTRSAGVAGCLRPAAGWARGRGAVPPGCLGGGVGAVAVWSRALRG